MRHFRSLKVKNMYNKILLYIMRTSTSNDTKIYYYITKALESKMIIKKYIVILFINYCLLNNCNI